MRNLIRAFAFCLISLLMIAPAGAATFSTNFSPEANGGADPNSFTVGPSSFTANDPNSVGASFFVMTPPLYFTNPNAWVIGPQGTLTIDFNRTVTDLSFWAIGLDGATVTVLGNVNEPNVVDVSGMDIKNTAQLNFTGQITGLVLQNTSGAPNIGNFAAYGASIDDISFTTVPEPAALGIVALALLLMGLMAFRSRPVIAPQRS